jgi:hypothetical protein
MVSAMNCKHLSLESNGILIKARKISQYLTCDLERLVAESACESEYLARACCLLEEIVLDQQQYANDWLLEECFDERQLRELLQYSNSVKLMPQTVKIYDSGYKLIGSNSGKREASQDKFLERN